MSNKVVYAKTQTNIFVPGAGDLGTVFPPQGKTLAGLTMELDDNGSLVLKFKYNARNHKLVVSSANLVVSSLVSEENQTTTLKAA